MSTDPESPPLFEPFAVQEIYLDGFFSDAHIHQGTFRCTAFSMKSMPGNGEQSHPVAVLRLIMTSHTARHFIEQATDVLTESGVKTRAIKSQRRRV